MSLHLGNISRNFQYKCKIWTSFSQNWASPTIFARNNDNFKHSNQTTPWIFNSLSFLSLTIEMHFQIGISLLRIHSTSYLYIQVGHLLLRRTFSEVFIPFRINSSMWDFFMYFWYFVGVCHNLLVDMVFTVINNNNFIFCRFWLTYQSWILNNLNEKICIKKNFRKHSFKLLI